jgi:toxin ParE1/3/4
MRRRKVRWARSARRDLEAIVAYLSDRSPAAALATLDRLKTRAESLATYAERGRVVPELARLHVRQYRELVSAPYRMIYRISGATVLMLVVVDARRSLEDLLLERLINIEGREA